MLIPLQEIIKKFNLNIKGVIQVGCHWAEEHEDFLKCGIKKFVYIEPCKEAFQIMIGKIGGKWEGGFGEMRKDSVIALNCACGAEEMETTINVSHNNQGQSNSLLQPKLHLQQHPEIVFTDVEIVKVMPLDRLAFNKEEHNLLIMDVQGYEGEVIKGATETLKHIDCIYTEINRDFTYENNMLIDEMDSFLSFYDFVRVETQWASPNLSWGDAVYLRQTLLK